MKKRGKLNSGKKQSTNWIDFKFHFIRINFCVWTKAPACIRQR